MKKTRIMALTLSAVLAISMFAGCGGGQTTGSSTVENGDVVRTASTAEEGDPYEIVVELMTYGSTPADTEAVQDAINEITVPAINATVRFLPITVADHATKVGLLTAGGEKVDLIMTGITSSAANLHANGVLTDVTDLLNEYAPELVEKEGKLLDAGKFDGRVYAIPGNLYPGESLNLLYNKDMAEEYGIDIPETLASYGDWDAFFEQCKEKLPANIYPFTLGDGTGASTVNWDSAYDSLGDSSYLAAGVLPEVKDGTEIENWYETDKYKQMVEKRREWYEKGYVVPDSMTSGFSTTDTITAGTCFSFQNPFQANLNEVTLSKATGVNLGYVKLSEPIITTGSTLMTSWGVPVTSEQPEKAIQLLNLIFKDTRLANLMNYGIEGEHYEKVSEHIIDYPEGSDPASIGWGGFINWFGDTSEVYQFAPITEDYYEKIADFGLEKATISNALGYTFDSKSVKTQMAAITSVIDTDKPSLECGLVDVGESLPAFLKDLKDAGMDEVIAENQKQYTEWLAKRE